MTSFRRGGSHSRVDLENTYWSDTDEQGGLTTSWYTFSVDGSTNRLDGEAYDCFSSSKL